MLSWMPPAAWSSTSHLEIPSIPQQLSSPPSAVVVWAEIGGRKKGLEVERGMFAARGVLDASRIVHAYGISIPTSQPVCIEYRKRQNGRKPDVIGVVRKNQSAPLQI